jgi:hypothetical protein
MIPLIRRSSIRRRENQKKYLFPYSRPENFGENMTADDKNIGGEVYTVISNKDTGKIAALIMSVKAGIVSDVLLKTRFRWRYSWR